MEDKKKMNLNKSEEKLNNAKVNAADTNDDEEEIGANVQIVTPGQLVLKRFLRNKLAIVGMVMILVLVLFCFVGPYLSPYGEFEMFYLDRHDPSIEYSSNETQSIDMSTLKINSKAPVSAKHLLGTDKDGSDVLTRLMYGGRISLIVGVGVTFLEILIGVTLGGIAGYYGGWVDTIVMRIVDIFLCLPQFPLMLIMSSIMINSNIPQKYQIYFLMLILGVLGWTYSCRVVRGQILMFREQEFMIATESTGIRPSRRIFKHLVPNVIPQIIVIASMGIGGIIIYESSLSFLGLGLPFPYASWGNMVNAVNDKTIMRNNMNIWLPPGICIVLATLGFNFIGDGLRDAFDPKMKR